MDKRIEILAHNIVNYSIELKKGEKVLITSKDTSDDIVKALIREIYSIGAIPYVNIIKNEIEREVLFNCNEEQLNIKMINDLNFLQQMDATIQIIGSNNLFNFSDIPAEKQSLYFKINEPLRIERTTKKKWVLLIDPSPSYAQASKMSTEEYENFYYKVCNLDYSKMNIAMDNLVNLMNKTDKVRLIAPNTDITFSIKNIPAVKCAGKMNIPDGEVFTAPVKNSVNGKISYNLDTNYNSISFQNVQLIVKDGKIIEANSNNKEMLNKILDTDEGARYFGEFSIGVNPYIKRGFQDILFDEKMTGSIHLTPGSCYETEAPNGNSSAIHWDLVLSMLPEHGGGEIYFDDKLIRKDGVFVIDELKCLNPENLI